MTPNHSVRVRILVFPPSLILMPRAPSKQERKLEKFLKNMYNIYIKNEKCRIGEMADTLVLGTSVERRKGSSPLSGTNVPRRKATKI